MSKDFVAVFRVSLSRFEIIAQQLCLHSSFWRPKTNANGIEGPCTAAKIMLPLKMLAFGVPPRAFLDYFQMSPQLARDCFLHFIEDLPHVFGRHYLQPPNKGQVKQICQLHKSVHGVPGMLGSLDCMHMLWDIPN